MGEEENVIIRKTYFEELLQRSHELAALDTAGVDNWEGYGEAMRVLHGEEDED